MINDAVKELINQYPEVKPEGYWKDGKGFIIKVYPTVDDEDFIEEMLYYVQGNNIVITNPIEHPIIIDTPMKKF